MPRHQIELARKQYERLPAVLKQALFSAEIAEQMFEIGKKFGLTIEKTGIAAEETGYVMLGLTRPNELVANLANELAISTEKAQDIAAEINHQIFFPLREELKRTHDFEMETSEVLGAGAARVSGMQMPPGIKKTFTEEKSPLVSDLTRITEQTASQKTSAAAIPAKTEIREIKDAGSPISGGGSAFGGKPEIPETSQLKQAPAPPRFEPFALPTGRIADLQKMVKKPPLPVTLPPTPPAVKTPVVIPTAPPEKKAPGPQIPATNGVEPWEKDLEKEVASLLKPPLIDLRSGQKPIAPPQPALQGKLPPIDLRQASASPTPPSPPPAPSGPSTPAALERLSTRGEKGDIVEPQPPAQPSAPRMTPQLQDLARPAQINTGPTLLEENLKREKLNNEAAPPQNAPAANPIPPPAATGDPYREPVDETTI